MGMNITPEMMAEDEQRWHIRDVIAELGYCGNYMRDRKDMTNIDIRFYAYLMRKAHEMLKAQEPRVMTLEEARETLHTSDFLVMEEPHRSSIFLGHRGEWHFDLSNGEYLDFDDLDVGSNYVVEYGKIFRFWTSRPTEEQRKAVEWNV